MDRTAPRPTPAAGEAGIVMSSIDMTTPSRDRGRSIRERLRTYGSLVAIAHTVFAMPFAAAAVVLAHAVPHVPLTAARVLAMLVCMVSARSSAMAYNRYADRDVDRENPRTQSRHIPSGAVSPREALLLTAVAGAVFVGSAATLGTVPLLLAPLVLLVLLGYSHAKRFTWASHAWLGLALALAPGGAWIAVGAAPSLPIVLFMGAVLTWLFGFDVLYSLQDETFDREKALHSVPARFGTKRALRLSALAHVATPVLLGLTGFLLGRGVLYGAAVALTALLLAYEHKLVGKGNLAKIDKAFFDVNAWLSVGFFVLTLADEWIRCEVRP
jgi:4-hydroxybenzoate polyprenyltransferase